MMNQSHLERTETKINTSLKSSCGQIPFLLSVFGTVNGASNNNRVDVLTVGQTGVQRVSGSIVIVRLIIGSPVGVG